MEKITWTAGIKSHKQYTLEEFADYYKFTTELVETDFEPNRNIHDIFYDHLKLRESKMVEVLYSGGMDSEFTLLSCIKNNVPVTAITMRIFIKGILLNVIDIYYAEKFCREHNIKQVFFDLDAVDFFESGQYLHYLTPYKLAMPHIASHMWLIEKCHSFPIIGGDWPWVQIHKPVKMLSPFKLVFSSYERFMKDNGIPGIGNMISHSFESSYYFMEKQIQHCDLTETTFHTIVFLKEKMYTDIKPRIKSYGWENCPNKLFNLFKYQQELNRQIKPVVPFIKWGTKIKNLIQSDLVENNTFI